MRKFQLIGLILVAVFIATLWGSSWLEDKIESEIQSISFLTYDSLEVRVFSRSLEIFNLTGKKDKYTGEIDLLKLKGLELIPLIRNKQFIVEEILIEGMDLSYQLIQSEKRGSVETKKNSGPDIPDFLVKSIDVRDGFFSILDNRDSLLFSTKLVASMVDFTTRDVRKPREIPYKLKFLEADSARFFTKNDLYEIDIASLKYDESSLSIDSIRLTSRVAKLEIGTKVGHEVDWYNASIDSVSLDIVDTKTFLKQPRVREMIIYQPVLNVFRDKRLPFPKENRPLLVRDVLSNSEFAFSFDTIQIQNGSITYEEFVKKEKGPGEVSFAELSSMITNFTSYSFEKNISPRLISTCKLYDKTPFYLDVSFPDNVMSTNTYIKGKLLPIDLTVFNKMIKYVSVVEIESGGSSMLEFEFTHTDKHSTGEMKFAYEDLSIAFLEKQESDSDGVLSAIKGFFVNTFIVDSNNNFESDKFRVGKVDFHRIENKSMFNFWWGSILTGFKSSTGVDASGKKIDVN
ncbi:hypothetical protein [Ekhidna sp.]